jgi:hypothetical protein
MLEIGLPCSLLVVVEWSWLRPALQKARRVEVIEVKTVKDKGLLDDSKATGSPMSFLSILS